MRYGSMLLAALVLSGCGSDSASRASNEPPATAAGGPQSGWLWVMVMDRSGPCIPGATLTVLRGQDSGKVVVPDANCDAWSYDGGGGYIFANLVPFVSMTIRASAPGYVDRDSTMLPNIGLGPITIFRLAEETK